MIVASLLCGAVVFVMLLRLTGAPAIGLDIVAVTRRATAAMADRRLSDDDKERLLRRASLRLFRDFFRITLAGLLAAAAPAAIVWAGVATGLFALHDVTAAATSLPLLVAMSVGSIASWFALERLT